MNKWKMLICVAGLGLVLLAIAAKLCGELDTYHLSQPEPHGQFTGSDRELLLVFFVVLLVGVTLVSLLVSGVVAVFKWKQVTFQGTKYASLFYWSFCVPIATYLLSFPSWALWHTVKDCRRYLW